MSHRGGGGRGGAAEKSLPGENHCPFYNLLFYIQPENDGFGHVTPLSDNSYENVTKARKIFFNYQF